MNPTCLLHNNVIHSNLHLLLICRIWLVAPVLQSHCMFWQQHSFRDHLLHALEGFALARRTPDKVIDFNLDYRTTQRRTWSRSATSVCCCSLLQKGKRSCLQWSFWSCQERPANEACGRAPALMPLQGQGCCMPSSSRSNCRPGNLYWTPRQARSSKLTSTPSMRGAKTKWLCCRKFQASQGRCGLPNP